MGQCQAVSTVEDEPCLVIQDASHEVPKGEPSWIAESGQRYPSILAGGRYDPISCKELSTPRTASHTLSETSTRSSAEVSDDNPLSADLVDSASCGEQADEILGRVRHLVEDEYDIVTARNLLIELRQDLLAKEGGAEMWATVTAAPVYQQVLQALGLLSNIGAAVCDRSSGWFTVWEDASKQSCIQGKLHPQNPTNAGFRVKVVFPVSLVKAVSIAVETDLTRLWNSALEKEPVVISRRGGLACTIAQHMIVLCGMLKFDGLDEIHRYVDTEGGFMAECIDTVPEGHPEYRAPQRGYYRALSGLQSAWVACGSESSVLILTGSIQLPFSISRRFAGTFGSFIGRHVVAALIKNALRTKQRGNPWAEALAKDRFGLYRRLNQCMESEASQARGRALARLGECAHDNLDLDRWFRECPLEQD